MVDRHFYEYKDGAIVNIGEMPITITVSIGEGAGGRGSMDFVRWNDAWIVADTEASRVLKLNDKLEVQSEIDVPTPYQLTIEGDQLHIASTANRFTIDREFKHVSTTPQPFESTSRLKKVEFESFRPQQLYLDADSGLTWYYLWGSLYQYHERKQEYRSTYISYNENDVAEVRIIPVQDEVIVILDRRLERFDRQGNWLGTVFYPRAEPDAIYDRTTQGENSLIVDEVSNVLYMVQGYRMIEIDLNRQEVTTLFQQNYADFGKLILHENELIFMLHSNEEDRWTQQQGGHIAREHMYTEIVKINPQAHHIRRYVVKGYYDSLELDTSSGDQPTFVLRSYN